MKGSIYESEYMVSNEGEHHYRMNGIGSKAFIANVARSHHHEMIGNKSIHSTLRTEIRNELGPQVDVTKNYSRLPKSHYDPQPNDYGHPVYDTLYKKAAKAGTAKGGI
jgi:hypothetical protein